MKTTFLLPAALLAAAVSGAPALAQDTVSQASTTAVSAAEPPVINHVVYLARLPTPAELMKGAESQATPITRMDQTTDRIMVTYQYAGGRTITFAYILLSSAASAPAPLATEAVAPANSPQVIVRAQAPTTTVVYADPDAVYYSPRYVRYYEPAWDFWAPLAVGVGLGWIGGHGGWHGEHDGWHGGHDGWHGHGGWSGHGGWHH